MASCGLRVANGGFGGAEHSTILHRVTNLCPSVKSVDDAERLTPRTPRNAKDAKKNYFCVLCKLLCLLCFSLNRWMVAPRSPRNAKDAKINAKAQRKQRRRERKGKISVFSVEFLCLLCFLLNRCKSVSIGGCLSAESAVFPCRWCWVKPGGGFRPRRGTGGTR